MSTRILTLFGEEIVPEQVNAVGRKRAVAKEENTEEPKEKKKKTPKKAQPKAVDDEQPQETEAQEQEEAVEVEQPKDPLAGWQGTKQYYTIGEVAKLFKVKTSNIRFWTNEFAMKVRTTRKGDRLYTPDQVREVKTIYHLVKERGYTINGAKKKLKESKNIAIESVDLKQSLLQLRNKLLQIRNNLT